MVDVADRLSHYSINDDDYDLAEALRYTLTTIRCLTGWPTIEHIRIDYRGTCVDWTCC